MSAKMMLKKYLQYLELRQELSVWIQSNSVIFSRGKTMGIKRISKLDDLGLFRQFSWSNELPDFERYNLIYGWNGTGKTTLSRLLRDLELGRSPKEGKAVLRIDNDDIHSENFEQWNGQIRVFNRDFVDNSVMRVDDENIPPIFVLGSENVEKQRELENLKKARQNVNSKLDSVEGNKVSAENRLDSFCVDRAKIIKDTLRSDRARHYDHYNKSNFKSDAEKMIDAGNFSEKHLDDRSRKQLLDSYRTTLKDKIQPINYIFPDLKEMTERIKEILEITVLAATVDKLTDDTDLSNWTRTGLKLHQERKSEQCLFCNQSLPEDLLTHLESHFSENYEALRQRVEDEIATIQDAVRKLREIEIPATGLFYDELHSQFDDAERDFRVQQNVADAFLETAHQLLTTKKDSLFEPVHSNWDEPSIEGVTIDKINEVVSAHNQKCDDFDDQVTNAREQLAEDMNAERLDEFISLKKQLCIAEENKAIYVDKIKSLTESIDKIESELIQHRRPADELNEDLREYLGHNELQLKIEDNGYLIIRDGSPAEALSEGEVTAIALLYFLKSLEDKDFSLENGIIVLDDPVSSLDANALYMAFAYIQQRTEKAGQLFIWTHNFAFFREVQKWFKPKNQNSKNNRSRGSAEFYMLDAPQQKDGTRNGSLRKLDPLLVKYHSEYHYHFKLVYDAATDETSRSLEQYYFLPNVARRMLEAFLAFRFPQHSGKLGEVLKDVKFKESKKRRILRFLHAHSHSDAIGEPEHDLIALAEGATVLNDLLDLMRSLDPEHVVNLQEAISQ